jgi:hypothetical protein
MFAPLKCRNCRKGCDFSGTIVTDAQKPYAFVFEKAWTVKRYGARDPAWSDFEFGVRLPGRVVSKCSAVPGRQCAVMLSQPLSRSDVYDGASYLQHFVFIAYSLHS